MQRSATAPADSPPDLQPAQLNALASLASGSSVTDAAEGAGVDRTTVHRWLREDVVFQAAWNSLRRDGWSEIEANLGSLLADALHAVREAVRDGDARIAMAVLKGAGVLSQASEIGPEDAGELREDLALARKERAAVRANRRLMIFI
jgi:hypothetical protein